MKITCPRCGSMKVARRGNYPKQRYQCTDSKHKEGESRYFYAERSHARILVFDIETLPGKKYFWRMGDQDWSTASIIEDWCVLSYAAKWLFEPEYVSDILTPKEAIVREDKRIVEGLWKLMDQADVLIAHNGDKFDIKKMNWRYVIHDMLPPSPYRSIDTLKASRSIFGATSHKLDWLARSFNVAGKLHTEYGLWKLCDLGDRDALDEMKTYNEQDIYILEDVYARLRPWIPHPNMSLYINTRKKISACTHCGSQDIKWDGTITTNARTYKYFRCGNCGAVGRAEKATKASQTRPVK